MGETVLRKVWELAQCHTAERAGPGLELDLWFQAEQTAGPATKGPTKRVFQQSSVLCANIGLLLFSNITTPNPGIVLTTCPGAALGPSMADLFDHLHNSRR